MKPRLKWFCPRCGRLRFPVKDKGPKAGEPKIRTFRTGFVAVFLECGHVTAATGFKTEVPINWQQ